MVQFFLASCLFKLFNAVNKGIHRPSNKHFACRASSVDIHTQVVRKVRDLTHKKFKDKNFQMAKMLLHLEDPCLFSSRRSEQSFVLRMFTIWSKLSTVDFIICLKLFFLLYRLDHESPKVIYVFVFIIHLKELS